MHENRRHVVEHITDRLQIQKKLLLSGVKKCFRAITGNNDK